MTGAEVELARLENREPFGFCPSCRQEGQFKGSDDVVAGERRGEMRYRERWECRACGARWWEEFMRCGQLLERDEEAG